MATKQEINKSKNRKVRVLFTMPALEGCNCLYLVGRFNQAYESVYRMQRAEDGTWLLALDLDPDCDYQFRYRSDRGIWYDDLAAKKYEPVQPRSEPVHA